MPLVAWLGKPFEEWTADEISETPTHQIAMACQRDMFDRHGQLGHWEREIRPVLWPDLMPAGAP